LGGADNITVSDKDLAGTDVKEVAIDLGADEQADTVNIATNGQAITVTDNNGMLTVSGLASTLTISNFDTKDNDQLFINGKVVPVTEGQTVTVDAVSSDNTSGLSVAYADRVGIATQVRLTASSLRRGTGATSGRRAVRRSSRCDTTAGGTRVRSGFAVGSTGSSRPSRDQGEQEPGDHRSDEEAPLFGCRTPPTPIFRHEQHHDQDQRDDEDQDGHQQTSSSARYRSGSSINANGNSHDGTRS